MRNTVYALLIILSAWWLYPNTVSASNSKAPFVFQIDESLSNPRYVHRPYPEDYKKKPTPQPQAKNTQAVRKTSPNSGRYNPCSCVSFARFKSGINVGPIGLAKYHPINSQIPKIGSIVVTNESWMGHVAVVVGYSDKTITIAEANYHRCKTSTRTISRNSPSIRGYYY